MPRIQVHPHLAGGLHGDDLMYVFGAPLTDGIDPFTSTFTRTDKLLAETIMRYWTNFIKTGYVAVARIRPSSGVHVPSFWQPTARSRTVCHTCVWFYHY